MQFFLLIFIALVLFFISFFLIKKQLPFLALIGSNYENSRFLKKFGCLYLLFGFFAIGISFLNHKLLSISYLIFLILISGIFSIIFSTKMTSKKK